ncbi:MAG: hypothetical protein PHR75_01950 [Sulfurovum sp.]|nr:hypothetical protein [Sulfurovum sp.]MDD3602823.1 hypothetical protein [Sulfurovum sp.]
MSAIINSTIKTNPMGRWYIAITDASNPEKTEICLDIYEYSDKIEAMGKEYEGKVEVVWTADSDVTPLQIHEIRQQMMAYEAEQEALKKAAEQNASSVV